MRKISLILVILALYTFTACSQEKSPFVSFEDYETLMAEVKEHRKARLLDLNDFIEMAKQEDVIILDARSNTMYTSKHIKGAVNLNLSASSPCVNPFLSLACCITVSYTHLTLPTKLEV